MRALVIGIAVPLLIAALTSIVVGVSGLVTEAFATSRTDGFFALLMVGIVGLTLTVVGLAWAADE